MEVDSVSTVEGESVDGTQPEACAEALPHTPKSAFPLPVPVEAHGYNPTQVNASCVTCHFTTKCEGNCVP